MKETEFDVGMFLGVLRRRMRLIAVTVILVLGATSIVLYALKPIYTASALVLVDPSRKDLLNPETQALGNSTDSSRVESEVELVRAESTLMQAALDAHLLDNSDFAQQSGWLDRALAVLHIREPRNLTDDERLHAVIVKLSDALTVQRRGFTYLISIEARSASPENAALLANAVANAYIEQQLTSKIASVLKARDVIEARIADASAAVAKSEQALDNFIDANIVQIAAETGRTDLAKLRQDLEDAIAHRVALRTAADQGGQMLADRDWKSLAGTLHDEAVAKLEADREALAGSLAATSDAAEATTLRRQLAAIESDLQTRGQIALDGVRETLTVAQQQATDLRDQLRTGVLGADLPATTLTAIYEVQQNGEIARSQYQALLARAKDLDAQAGLQIADSRVVSEALVPLDPSFPNPRLILLGAAAISVLLGVLLAFLYENVIGGVTSPEQLMNLQRVSSVVAIARQRTAKRRKDGTASMSLADQLVDTPLSSYSESFRRTRVGVDQSARRASAGPTPRGRVIMVTSASPGEGKTTTALGLARTYALSGNSTLLIDCDLRRPSLHSQTALESSIGLREFLTLPENERSLTTILKADPLTSVELIVGARASDQGTDQLVSGTMFKDLIAAGTRAFDVVILDTPPIGPVVDALYLAQYVDAILFVVRWGTTTQRDVRNGLAAMDRAKRPDIEIVGLINQQQGRELAYETGYAGYYARA